jgi:RHH-type transcriptional regulator, rel operon repressor / antitoxin RelB
MNKPVNIGARITEQLNDSLGRLADATGRSKSWLISEAVRSYVDTEAQFIAAVEQGLAERDAGALVEHADVVEDFERRKTRD